MSKKENFQKEIKQLVIARLKTIPSNKRISIGKEGAFTVDELIDDVKRNNEIGKKIIEVQMNFLQSLKNENFLDE